MAEQTGPSKLDVEVDIIYTPPPYSEVDPNNTDPPAYSKRSKSDLKAVNKAGTSAGCARKRRCGIACVVTLALVITATVILVRVMQKRGYGYFCGVTDDFLRPPLLITCNDDVGGVYLDGDPISMRHGENWTRVDYLRYPIETEFLAVKCVDVDGKMSYVIAAIEDRLIPDSTWKCTSQLERDWMSPGFNDSHWPAAVVKETNEQYPWYERFPGMSKAKWIWSSSNSSEVYCRTKLSEASNNPYHQGPSPPSRALTTEASAISPSVINITCDDDIKALYLDGHLTNVENADNWRRVGHVTIPVGTRTLAVKCADVYGVRVGLMAATTDGLVTDSAWKCTSLFESDWMSPAFSDSHWLAAVVKGTNGQSPWNMVLPGMSTAKWIWSSSRTGEVYCRITLI